MTPTSISCCASPGIINQFLDEVCAWLAATPASASVVEHPWIVPTIQSVHIAAVSIVFVSAGIINLRLIGVLSNTQGVAGIVRSLLPWIWVSLAVLFLTGLISIIGEPSRELKNSVFWLKMLMVVVAALVTGVFGKLSTGEESKRSFPGLSGKIAAVGSLLLWAAIIVAGRMIAYNV